MDLQTGTRDDMVDSDPEMFIPEQYQNQYRRYGDAPTAHDLARPAPTLQATALRSHQRAIKLEHGSRT
jgi:hypothetical protein